MEDTLHLLTQEKEELDKVIDTLHQSLSSLEGELSAISSQWEGRWQGLSKDISNWQEAAVKDFEAKIENIKQELPDKSELEEWEKKINTLQQEGENLKNELANFQEEKNQVWQEGEQKLNELKSEILKREEELANYQKLTEQSIGEINKQVSELTAFVNSVEQRLQEVETQSATWSKESQEALENLKASLSRLSQKLEEISSFSHNILEKELETKIISLEGKIEEMRKELDQEKQIRESSYPVTSPTEESGETKGESVSPSSLGKGGEEILVGEVPSQSKEELSGEIKTLAEEKMNLEEELKKKQEEMLKIDQELEKLREEKGS